MALQPWRTGKVIRIEDQTHNTKRFWIETPEIASFDFIPGQFVTFDLPIHEKPNKRWRSYSIASWPDGTNVFELVIVLTPGGAGTNYLFNEVTIGSELKYRGAQGVFTLPAVLEKEIFMVCTGTGIAPFRSMLYHIKIHKIPFNKITLIFGCRFQKDILYYDELKQLQEELPNFQYIVTLSREQWDGRMGYVHPVYEELIAAHQPANFYLCGWKNMIDEAKKRLIELGYDTKSIHLELYG
ncbi:MAG: ferredoxin--NADP reductase [Chitinophagales bacterium]